MKVSAVGCTAARGYYVVVCVCGVFSGSAVGCAIGQGYCVISVICSPHSALQYVQYSALVESQNPELSSYNNTHHNSTLLQTHTHTHRAADLQALSY